MSDGVIRLAGAGLTGTLLAILLQRRGARRVEIYESRPDIRQQSEASGRSINLALADRGIQALKAAGLFGVVEPNLVPMRGRMIHQVNRETIFQPYGQRPNEVIYSVSRHRLNQLLLTAAARCPDITLRFEHRIEAADFAAGLAHFRDIRGGRTLSVPMAPLLAADGAGSAMRREMSRLRMVESRETDLDHGYKELSIPADATGSYRMAGDALHIWPRGQHMLIALPNGDGSFTATLFLPKQGDSSFESLATPEAIDRFLSTMFPDARELMPDCVQEFGAHPVGFLGTVSVSPWHAGGRALLIGDAAHAMVPFHGQGMNCCFEDCVELESILGAALLNDASRDGSRDVSLESSLKSIDESPFEALHQISRQSLRENSGDPSILATWEAAFAQFYAVRKPNTDAIAAMALENYREMRERVVDRQFQLQQTLSLELERRFPRRFIPRYSMVMFHHEIPYKTALERGALQSGILASLTDGAVQTVADVDFNSARTQIMETLPPL